MSWFVVLIRHHLKSPGCISVTRNKNITIKNQTRSLSFSRRERLSTDLNLPVDVNVCGAAGSAPPLSHQHTSMSSLLSDLWVTWWRITLVFFHNSVHYLLQVVSPPASRCLRQGGAGIHTQGQEHSWKGGEGTLTALSYFISGLVDMTDIRCKRTKGNFIPVFMAL